MTERNSRTSPTGLVAELVTSCGRVCSRGGIARLGALVSLTVREALRSRVLLGMTGLMCLFAAGSLLWPGDVDRDRVILVQRFSFGALTFFGLIAAAFLGGSVIPRDVASKRIYSISTKPVSRLELLLGRVLGLMAVMLIFLALGGLITLTVTHIASARKSYEGGSYQVEVMADSVEVTPDDPAATDPATWPVVRKGQILKTDGRSGDRFHITHETRDASVSGTIPASAVHLIERTLEVQRVAEPAEVSASCRDDTATFSHNELFLRCNVLAVNDRWTFDFSQHLGELPADQPNLHVRLRFGRLLHEPVRRRGSARQSPRVTFVFDPDSAQPTERTLEFDLQPTETRPGPRKGRALNAYEEVFTLPSSLLASGKLEARVADYSPRYPPGGRVLYTEHRSPTWRIRGFDAGLLPKGRQTIRACFIVYRAGEMDLIDHTEVTAVLRNPASGATRSFPLELRNKTTSSIHFDRELVDRREGVEISLRGIRSRYRVGHQSRDVPLHLVLRRGAFWASTTRSVFLIFLHLSLFIVLAVAASTFLSAPVAILLTLVVALSGMVKEMVLEAASRAGLETPLLIARELPTLQERVWLWMEYGLRWLLVVLAPGLDRFSSTGYINRGWAVPWSAVLGATLYASVYMVLSFAFGYLMFRVREFE